MLSSWLEIRACHFSDRANDHGVSHHRHRDPQWYCCVSGRLRIEIDGEAMFCEPGEHVLISPWRYRYAAPEGQASYLMLRFRSSCVQLDSWSDRVNRLPERVAADLHELCGVLSQGLASDSRLSHYSRPSNSSKSSVSQHTDSPLVEVLLLRLLLAAQMHEAGNKHDLNPQGELSDPSAAEELVQQAEKFIERHLAESITRVDIARACHCSPAHLARLTLARRQATPQVLLTNARMRRARELLLRDTQSTTTVAIEVGYATASHFAKVFKQYHGLTPKAFRRGGGRLWWQTRPQDEGPLE